MTVKFSETSNRLDDGKGHRRKTNTKIWVALETSGSWDVHAPKFLVKTLHTHAKHPFFFGWWRFRHLKTSVQITISLNPWVLIFSDASKIWANYSHTTKKLTPQKVGFVRDKSPALSGKSRDRWNIVNLGRSNEVFAKQSASTGPTWIFLAGNCPPLPCSARVVVGAW